MSKNFNLNPVVALSLFTCLSSVPFAASYGGGGELMVRQDFNAPHMYSPSKETFAPSKELKKSELKEILKKENPDLSADDLEEMYKIAGNFTKNSKNPLQTLQMLISPSPSKEKRRTWLDSERDSIKEAKNLKIRRKTWC